MKFTKYFVASALLSVVISTAWADDRSEGCRAAAENFAALSSNVKTMMGSAYGYAVFPTIGKGGLGIGGAGGAGCVYKGGARTGTTKMGQVTIGFQAGGQAYSQIILFENQRAYDVFTSGEFEFGAQATAVAITVAAQAETSTKGSAASAGTSERKSGGKASSYTNGMAVFTVAKGGLMYEASIGGQKFSFEAL